MRVQESFDKGRDRPDTTGFKGGNEGIFALRF